jgi:hypothetical protein
MVAGLFSGLTEALIVNPFEVVKVKQQTDKRKFTQVLFQTHKIKEVYLKLSFVKAKVIFSNG